MNLVYGLTGHSRSGKDSSYEFIKKVYPEAQRFAFADILKEELYEKVLKEYDIGYDVFEGPKKADVRYLMQGWGDFKRGFVSSDYWINKMESIFPVEGFRVITDIRYNNEVDFLRRYPNAKLIRVNRPGFNGNGHSSETEQDNFVVDYELLNYGTLGDLYMEVEEMLVTLGCT